MPPPPPRAYRSAAGEQSTFFFLLFGLIQAGVGGIVFTVFSVSGGPFWYDLVLSSRGAPATAMATRLEPNSSRVNSRRVYEVYFTFTTRRGERAEGSAQSVDSDLLERARKHEPLAIEYDPKDPSIARFTGHSASPFGLFILMPLALMVVGLAVFAIGFRRRARTRHIYINGEGALAKVERVEKTNMRINNRTVQRVVYSFDTGVGRITGTSTAFKDPPPAGSELWVLYLASDPQQNVAA